MRAVRCFEADQGRAGAHWLLAALAGAIGFLVVKTHEFAGKVQQGFDWATDSFTLLYTLLTGFHYLHVLVGAIVFAVLWFKARAGAYGAICAMALAAAARLFGGAEGFTPVLPLDWIDLAAAVPCPLLAAGVAALSARRTALSILRAEP